MLGLLLCSLSAGSCAPSAHVVLEAESGHLVGVDRATARVGFSGSGYVTGLDGDGDRIHLTFRAERGEYRVLVRYSSPSGQKGIDVTVEGQPLSSMLLRTGERWAEQPIGRVVLAGGPSSLVVRKGWGYFDLDRIELVPVREATAVASVHPRPCDPQASPEARALLKYLASQYGKATLSGQIGEEDESLVARLSGRSSAILAGDLMDYSPSRRERGAQPGKLSERLIRNAQEGRIVSLMWHWNAPIGLDESRWYEGFQADATSFDVGRALANPGGPEHRLLLRDIDAIADELRKFRQAGVPVLWRPLHEADQEGFWWGRGGSEVFRKLWRVLYERLTKHHGLHNLIWVCTLSDPSWYPGDDVVDIVGVDAYPPSPKDLLTGDWDRLLDRFNGRKMLALSEVAGVPDIEAMHRRGVRWSFFISWRGRLGPRYSPEETVRKTYQSQSVVTLDELPLRRARGF